MKVLMSGIDLGFLSHLFYLYVIALTQNGCMDAFFFPQGFFVHH